MCHKSIGTTRSCYKSDHQSLSLAQKAKAEHVGGLKGAEGLFDDFDLDDFDFVSLEDAIVGGSCSSASWSICENEIVQGPAPVPAPVAEPPVSAPKSSARFQSSIFTLGIIE